MNAKKLVRLQKIFCWVPTLSTLAIFIITVLKLKQNKDRIRDRIKPPLSMVILIIAVAIVNNEVMSGLYPILNFVVIWGLATIENLYLLTLQQKSNSKKDQADQVEDTQISKCQKPSKRVWIYVIILHAVLLIVAVSVSAVIIASALNDQPEIADTNGEDNYSLCTITTDDFIAQDDYGSVMGQRHIKGKSTGVDSPYDEYDHDFSGMNGRRFNGICILQSTLCADNSLTLTIDSEVKKGNFAIIVLVDGAYYCDVDVNTTQKIVLNDVQGKTVLVKIAGESANFSASSDRRGE